MTKKLEFLDRYLKDKEYLANGKYSLADTVAAVSLDRFFRLILKPKTRGKLANLSAYVKRVINETPLLRKLEYTDKKFKILKVDLKKLKKEQEEKKKKELEELKKLKELKKEPKKKVYEYPPSKLDINDFKMYVANEKD